MTSRRGKGRAGRAEERLIRDHGEPQPEKSGKARKAQERPCQRAEEHFLLFAIPLAKTPRCRDLGIESSLVWGTSILCGYPADPFISDPDHGYLRAYTITG